MAVRTLGPVGAVVLPVATLLCLGCGDSQPVPRTFWTTGQAESIRVVRGAGLETTRCAGLGEARSSGYRRFRCVGVLRSPTGLAYSLPVRVRYILNPRGPYRGRRSAYLATSVFFDSFGVP